MGWMNDFTGYMQTDPLYRKGRHGTLLFSMVYAYSEYFILVFSHDEVVHLKASMLMKMPGNMEQKYANLRAAYGWDKNSHRKKNGMRKPAFHGMKQLNQNMIFSGSMSRHLTSFI